MTQANPWGVNDVFSIGWPLWERIGQVQNPYLRFGSGYGPLLLTALILLFSAVCYFGIRNLRAGEKSPEVAFTLFYIINVVFNQTQPWIASGSLILFSMGFCAGHIMWIWSARSFVPASWVDSLGGRRP
jgi:hypothetical protein